MIDHKSEILPDEEGTKVLKREEVVGELTFENVNFVYPTKQENKVLTDLSFTIKAGQTVGLVGPSGSGKSSII